MPTISLKQLLLDRQGEQAVLVSEHGSWSLSDVNALVNAVVLNKARGYRSIALRLSDPVRLALALLALDGFAERLLLLSADIGDDLAGSLSAQFGADAVLTDLDCGSTPPAADRLIWTGPIQAGSDENRFPSVQTEWTLTTSGTTGVPKLVPHTLESLSRTTKIAASAKYRWGQLFGLERFAGLQVFLQGMLGGVLVLPRTDWTLSQRLLFLSHHRCTALSATPTLWRKILMTPASSSLEPIQVTLGGEVVDDSILGALARRFPASRIVHVYASTEAGVGFSVKDGRAGFPVDYLSAAPGGVRLKIVDGRLFIQNPQVRLGNGTEFVDTGDAVTTVGERCYFLGRASGVINVGGNKLYPEEVEQILLAHPAVRQARVWGTKNPITGELVTAEIVPASGHYTAHELRDILQKYCTDRLERWKTPAIIRVVEELEMSTSGKMKRNPL